MRSALVPTLSAALGLAGCGASEVSLTISGSTAAPAVGSALYAEEGTSRTGTPDPDSLLLTASDGLATVEIALDRPTVPGRVTVGERHLSVSLTLRAGCAPGCGPSGPPASPAWSSNGGAVVFDALSPYRVRLEQLEMIAAAGGAAGSFYLTGSATFR